MDSDLKDFIEESEFLWFLKNRQHLMDVRSEIEFSDGHIPNSTNIPILENREREIVGTLYKQNGRDAAVKMGHELVSGTVRENRINAWINALKNMNHGAITCYRGGLRSQIAQDWCREYGVHVPRIKGGTKALRNFLIGELDSKIGALNLNVIAGATGSGKSLLIKSLMANKPCLDLEAYAEHRGSAFGGFDKPQPSQIFFENRIACELICLESLENVLIEDESLMIGNLSIPRALFSKLRESPVIFIDENLDSRTKTTYDEYIVGSGLTSGDHGKAHKVFEHYRKCVFKISKRLGGARTAEILKNIAEASSLYDRNRDLEPNKIWIRKLLEWYYDPRYLLSLNKRNVNCVFQGNRKEVLEFLTGT